MTARDAATEAAPDDEAATSSRPHHATTADATTPDATTAETSETAVAEESTGGAGGTAGATGTDGDPTTDAEATVSTADADADGAPRRRRGRRHRHATGDDLETAADAEDTDRPDGRRPPRRHTRWILTAALVVSILFAGAMAGLWYARRPVPIAGLTSSQQAAVTAATQAAINLQTFRRASFDQDFANALASLTPQFAQQQLAPRKDALKQQLDQGGRDATATALSAGLASSTATQAVVLVVTNTTQTADNGTSTPFVFSRLQLTLQLQGGKWLVSDLSSVGLS